MKEIALISGLVSGAVGLGSTLALLKGSAVTPWSMQTYKGESEREIKFRADARWWTKAGLVGFFVAFVFSIIATVASYLS